MCLESYSLIKFNILPDALIVCLADFFPSNMILELNFSLC